MSQVDPHPGSMSDDDLLRAWRLMQRIMWHFMADAGTDPAHRFVAIVAESTTDLLSLEMTGRMERAVDVELREILDGGEP